MTSPMDVDGPGSPLTRDQARELARKLWALADAQAAPADAADRHPSARPLTRELLYGGNECPHGVPKRWRTSAQTAACALCRRAITG